MTEPHEITDDRDQPTLEAEALRALAAADSVVDLLALVGTMDAQGDSDLWHRAVNSRLEAILAQKMRRLIARDDDRQNAA
jgi:hypothetical protein